MLKIDIEVYVRDYDICLFLKAIKHKFQLYIITLGAYKLIEKRLYRFYYWLTSFNKLEKRNL